MEERSGFGYFLLGLGIGVAAGILLKRHTEAASFRKEAVGEHSSCL
jgi:hypothetical protein